MADTVSHPYSCVGCQLAFSTAAAQRAHYSQDLHRYNAKRRVANLPPVSAQVYEEKVAATRQDDEKAQRFPCDACDKVFSSENAYTDHLNSRKHKEAAARPPSTRLPSTKPSYGDVAMMTPDVSDEAAVKAYVEANATLIPSLTCLFCPRTLSTLDLQLEHMHKDHGFFLPDGEYLVDAAGLVAHAAEEIGVFNTCLYCGAMFGRYVNENEGALAETKRAQRGLEAVRKHMNDKSHCKLKWDTEADQLEWADFYDFSSSYADADGEGWEDTEDAVGEDEEGDAIMVDTKGRPVGLPPPAPAVRFGDTEYELILPSGKRIGHRALKHVYKANYVPYMNGEAKQTKAARRLAGLEERRGGNSSSLVPVSGGSGAFGRGQQVVRAKNAGEARHAQAASRGFAQQKAQQRKALKLGIVGNSQEHYRDMLLQ